jgi:Flp pilus assembly protein TadG
MRTRRTGDRGNDGVELAIAAPVLLVLALLLLILNRAVTARMDVNAVADAAARAASLQRDPASAQAAAEQTAAANLGDGRTTCTPLVVVVDTSEFAPGGQVAVTVSCTVSYTDLAGGLSLPGTTTISGQATSPVDVYRGVIGQP